MENQPTGQIAEQDSSAKIWYIAGTAIIIALGLLYFFTNPVADSQTPQTSIEQAQIPAPTAGNTTADISADLDQIPDSSAELDADAAAASSDLQAL